MKVKGNKRSKIGLLMGFTGAALLATGALATSAMAQVKGSCVNCHTMHNSQDGAGNTQVHIGSGAGWNAASGGALTGGITTTEQALLLRTDCVGCHSATAANSATIVTDANGNKVPIVFNIGGTYPANPLAGGNFALNTGSANIYGHNVAGISNAEMTPPGLIPAAVTSCAVGCHKGLAEADAPFGAGGPLMGGCKGCHNQVGHHKANDTSYRFLGGHPGGPLEQVSAGGAGSPFEDSDWEATKTAADHNIYPTSAAVVGSDGTMGDFCVGCHQNFHSDGGSDGVGGVTRYGVNNGGDDNFDDAISGNPLNQGTPWLRHPSNVKIPLLDATGEYAAMAGVAYDPKVPVAQDPAGGGSTALIDDGDQVTCLSCHVAHASQYADALRFNYSKMNAHSYATEQDTGCFFCHRNKDI